MLRFPFQTRHGMMAAVLLLAVGAFSCGQSRGPSQLSRFPSDLKDERADAAGIYEDGWLAATASASLQQPNGDQMLSIRGTIPQIDNGGFKTDVALFIDNAEIGRRTLGVGDFQLSVPVKRQTGRRRVTVTFGSTQQLPGGDGRAVGAQLKFLGFDRAQSGEADNPDIVRGANLELGRAWGEIETYRQERFRWVENDAQVLITPESTGNVALLLTVEAGPGVGGKFLLKAVDALGRQVAAERVEGRQTVRLFLPVEAGRPNEFRLHVDGGGKRIASDPRILNFRVFRAQLAAPFQP